MSDSNMMVRAPDFTTAETPTTQATARRQLARLADALVEDIMATSDEDILVEIIEDGGDPDKIVADLKASYEAVLAKHLNEPKD